MLKGKCFLDYTNSFSPNQYGRNDKIILKYFQKVLKRLRRKWSIVLFVVSIENLKIQQCHTFSRKHQYSLLFEESLKMRIKKFKEEESVKILKILGLIINIEEYQKNI